MTIKNEIAHIENQTKQIQNIKESIIEDMKNLEV